jgi:hypothetical protein
MDSFGLSKIVQMKKIVIASIILILTTMATQAFAKVLLHYPTDSIKAANTDVDVMCSAAWNFWWHHDTAIFKTIG